MAAVRERGLRVTGIWGERVSRPVAVTSPADVPWTPDVVLVTVKSFDTGAAVRDILENLGPRTLVVSLQNGIGNAEKVAELCGAGRAVGGTVITGFELREPGVVAVTVSADSSRLGRLPRGCDEPVRNLARVLTESGVPTLAVENIGAYIWGKVLYNAALNPLGAVLRVNYGALAAESSWRIIESIVGEAFRALAAEGVELLWRTPEEYLAYLRGHQLPATAAHRPSMLQDIERGHRTEIDYISGAIAALAHKHSLDAPVNEGLVALVRFLEAHGGSGASRGRG
jgi:2-dehydropantoate 2-reductase